MPESAAIAGLFRPVVPDEELLSRYLATRDESAFADLVKRHGPTVLRVCRGLVRQPADAEDAYQATFLLLLRHAGKVRNRAAVGAWLYGAAVKVATRIRVRRKPEPLTADPVAIPDLTVREAEALFHEELARLPAKFRDPLVLCCLDALTRDEAARQLGLSVAAVKHRLERGRELLKANLTRRGVTVGVPLLAGWLAPAAVATVPGVNTHTVAPAVSTLVHEVGAMLFASTWKSAVSAALVAVAVGGFGVTLAVGGGDGPGPLPGEPKAVKAKPPAEEKPMDEPFVIPPVPLRTGLEQKAMEPVKMFIEFVIDPERKPDEVLTWCLPKTVTAAHIAAVRKVGGKWDAPGVSSIYDAYGTATYVAKSAGKESAALLLASVEVEPGKWKVMVAEALDEAKVEARLKELEASWAKHPVLSQRAKLWAAEQFPGLAPVPAREKEFEELSAVIKPSGLSNELPANITIGPDGKCVYDVGGRAAVGKRPAWPAVKVTHTLPPDRLRRLTALLKETEWLGKEASKAMPQLHSTDYTLNLKRDGKGSTAFCRGEQEPYLGLTKFLAALSRQEYLLYQLESLPDPDYASSARDTLDSYLKAELGGPFAKPNFELDDARFAGWATARVRKPEGKSADEVAAAVRLVGVLRMESERKPLTELKSHPDSGVKEAATVALARLADRPVVTDSADRVKKLAETLEGYRTKMPPPEALIEENGKSWKAIEPYLETHLAGVARRLNVTTKAECLLLLTYLKDADGKLRFIAAVAIEGLVKANPGGMSSDMTADPKSDAHRDMVLKFVARLDAMEK